MAHKTKVNGTAYDIAGGITKVSGTGYSIKKGRTLVGGTAYNISFAPPLADCTPGEIQTIAQSGQAANYWAVGDTVPIAINGSFGGLSYNGTVYAFILGFDHNSDVEGSNTIHFQFGKTSEGVDIAFVQNYNSNGTGFCMNTSNTNSGGWASSYMRTTICAAFLKALPSTWQSVIASCTKYTNNKGQGSYTESYVTATSDKIWLLAEFELYGTRCANTNMYEQNYQKQYDYYKAGNSKAKYQHNATTTSCWWFLRTPWSYNGTYFCNAATGGDLSGSKAYYSRGFAPCFMVA